VDTSVDESGIASVTTKAGKALAILSMTAHITGLHGSTKWCIDRIKNHTQEYETAASMFTFHIPWEVIAVIHSLEGGLDFRTALHNGDRIIGTRRKTYNWPSGRGPFKTWAASAYDAIMMKESIIPKVWTIGNTLDFLERYNGLGYRLHHKNVNSPYLWSGTNKYTRGKYVSDGKWSSTAVSKQVGAVVLLMELDYFDGRAK